MHPFLLRLKIKACDNERSATPMEIIVEKEADPLNLIDLVRPLTRCKSPRTSVKAGIDPHWKSAPDIVRVGIGAQILPQIEIMPPAWRNNRNNRLSQLAELIYVQWQCCPFLTFVLQVPARKNALDLEIKGPEGAKR